jgi:hypothetical protein
LKNMTPDLYRRNWMSITSRDLVVLGCCLVREHSSLAAFWYVIRNWRRVLQKRAEIMRKRRVSDEYLASWFSHEPVAKPAPSAPSRSISGGQRAVRR